MHIQPYLEAESLITGIHLPRVDKDKEEKIEELDKIRRQKSKQGKHSQIQVSSN